VAPLPAEGAGAPVRGAVVTLLTPSGAPTDRRVLTDQSGAFAMRAPQAGSWAIEVRAIGYAARKTSPRQVSAGETVGREHHFATGRDAARHAPRRGEERLSPAPVSSTR
jgi:hypothetical protein